MKNIQTGNECYTLQFDNYARVVYTENLRPNKFLVVSFSSNSDSHVIIQEDEMAIVTECLGSQSCLDDCLKLLEDHVVIQGWHAPQVLGI
jgi:hypothetical protein